MKSLPQDTKSLPQDTTSLPQKEMVYGENVSYSVMHIKKGLSMIRLYNLQQEKTMPYSAQQTQVLLHPGIAYMRIRWRSCKVCCSKKHLIQCNILIYLRKTKKSAIKQVPVKYINAIYL